MLPLALQALPPQEKKKSQGKEQQEDSLARLISADTLQIVEIHGVTYRKVKGKPAKFLHNNTYLLCDSALWNVDAKVINAVGHVKLIQDNTTLTSETLDYFVERDMAEFRGGLVQLRDKDNNILRTKYLDYNTKDSVAVFRNGASMRDKDGQIIESRTGTYDSKIKTFTFSDDVNMFTDSVFVKTSYLKYESEQSLATFGYNTHAWKDDNMLSAHSGWYRRDIERFFFTRSVHIMGETQEGWCDSIYFNRATNDVKMLGNAQVSDTTRNVYAVAGLIDYIDSLGRTFMTRDPAVISEVDETDDYGRARKDTVFFGADTMIYRAIPMWQVDSLEKVHAAERRKSVDTDPVTTHRQKTAEAARKAAEEAAANDPNSPTYKGRPDAAAQTAAEDAQATPPAEEPSRSKEKKTRDNTDSQINNAPGEGGLTAAAMEKIKADKKAEKEAKAAEKAARKAEKEMQKILASLGPGPESGVEPSDTAAVADTVAVADSLTMTFGASQEDFKAMDAADSVAVADSAMDYDEPDGDGSGSGRLGRRPNRHMGLGDVDQQYQDQGMDQDGMMMDDAGMMMEASDTTAAADSTVVKEPLDTTKMGFVQAFRNVKIFRKSMQVVCDSLSYNDLDSLSRLYYSPVIWNEGGRHQYVADSVYAVIRNQAMEKANLLDNAFIHIEEDTTHYDQIKSVEMTAFFDKDGGALARFDALGGAQALFYIEENDALATVNRKDCKMLSAYFKDGDIEKIYYFETAKSDGYPVVQLSKEDQHLKGFNWQPDLRPKSRYDITPLTLRKGQRAHYEAIPEAKFVQTDIYFPGYIADVHRQMEIRDSMAVVRAAQREKAQKEKARLERIHLRDSLMRDSLARVDSLLAARADSVALADSIARVDSLAAVQAALEKAAADSLAALEPKTPAVPPAITPEEKATMTPQQIAAAEIARKAAEEAAAKAAKEAEKAAAKAAKEAEKERKLAEKEEKKAQKQAALEEKWAALDARDAAKEAARAEKKAEKARQDKLKALQAAKVQEDKDAEALRKYIEKFRKKKAREDARAAIKAARAAEKAAQQSQKQKPARSSEENTPVPEPEIIITDDGETPQPLP